DRFLGATRARAAFRIGVELRTFAHFTRRYLATLHAHGAAHVCNAWTRMPPIGWQHDRAAAPSQGERDLFMVRAMLRPGTLPRGAMGPSALVPGSRYEEAGEGTDIYLIINNQLEGHAPGTIEELQRELWG